MRARRCTIDSSCLIALDHVGLIPKLSVIFSKVLIPRAVRRELFRRRTTKDRLLALLREYAFLERCDRYDAITVDLLLLEREALGGRDRGEAEAVVQASQVGATVIVDDRWGRDLASRFELESHGTLWILRRLYELQLLSAAELKAVLISISQHGIRLPRAAVNALLVEAGEEPLLDQDA